LAPCVNFLQPSALALPALGTCGNLAKGVLRGPGMVNTDMGIFKKFAIRENTQLQFRAKLFNAFNHSNFNNPSSSVSGAGLGQILGSRDPRIIQLVLKVLIDRKRYFILERSRMISPSTTNLPLP
jgi:hypothetical protein